jgi:hypothetical protein
VTVLPILNALFPHYTLKAFLFPPQIFANRFDSVFDIKPVAHTQPDCPATERRPAQKEGIFTLYKPDITALRFHKPTKT